MTNLDDVIRNAVSDGNIAKPLMIALLGAWRAVQERRHPTTGYKAPADPQQ